MKGRLSATAATPRTARHGRYSRFDAVFLVLALATTPFDAARGVAQTFDSGAVLLQSGADREAQLIDGAKREGEVVLYTCLVVTQALRPMIDAFEAKYAFLKVSYWRGDGDSVVNKVGVEIRANNVICDVMEGTGIGQSAIEGNVSQPFYTPLLARYPEKYHTPNNLWAPTWLSYFSLAYNTRIIAADRAPKSYADLVDPKWKGKLSWHVESETGATLFLTNLRLAWGEDRAMAYFRELAKQEIVNFVVGSSRSLVDRVIAGEFPIALNIFAHHPLISHGKGAAVAAELLDPTPSTVASVAIARGAPHPNAALLLADFFLSDEGQEIFAKQLFYPANPAIAPPPLIASVVPSVAGVPENFVSPENLRKFTASSEKIYQDLFR